MTSDARIRALAEGREVGEVCPVCASDDVSQRIGWLSISNHPCQNCNGTGRINTEPAPGIEVLIARLRAEHDVRGEAIQRLEQALEAERAAHQREQERNRSLNSALEALEGVHDDLNEAHEATKRQLQDLRDELVRISGAEDWEAAIGWILLLQVALEGTKRQLQRVRERVCKAQCYSPDLGFVVTHSRLCEQIRHG